ncbi:hypothetical protein QQP08_017216 [Theobroma cacao]|nr:hypothetical protein QQP08_017216 [Theobroma cacao]
MEVRITSRETVQPSSQEVHLLKPFKLSFLDQLIPAFYVPLIFFYTQSSNSHFDSAQILARLKESLSKTLNQFYPLSGRTIDNFCIDYYREGVPYIEARVNGCLSDYLQSTELEKLNHLIPCEPFCYFSDPAVIPQLAVQVNIFDCGGIALAMCCSHKIIDASTVSAFLRSWAAFSRGSNGEIPHPDLLEASSRLFPPMDSMPPNFLSSTRTLWFKEERYKTRRFVFDANAIATLMFKAKSKSLEHPSRVEALTAFIWKYAMLACASASGILKPSVLCQAVNLRHKMKPRLPDYSVGNLIRFAATAYEPADKDIELHHLAYLLREAVENYNTDYLQSLQGDEGFKVISEKANQVAEFAAKGNAQVYVFSSWLNFGMHQVDFGWGKPSWIGIPGVVSPAFTNLTFLKEIGQEKAVEAWVTLDEKKMTIFEHDHEFLAFASPNPHYDKVKI